MKRVFLILMLATALSSEARAACQPTYQHSRDTYSPCLFSGHDSQKTSEWRVTFPDGYYEYAVSSGFGQCASATACCDSTPRLAECYPLFHVPVVTDGKWEQRVDNREARTVSKSCAGGCSDNTEVSCVIVSTRSFTVQHRCPLGDGELCTTPRFNGMCPDGSPPNARGECCGYGGGGCDSAAFNDCIQMFGWTYDQSSCSCYCMDACAGSPVLLDIEGDGLALTPPRSGVAFDLDRDGQREQLSWTHAGSDDAWLALDRDGDGLIENGDELFGNYTEQPASPRPNGFAALAEFDRGDRGGNEDGAINAGDAVFNSLRLWRDANHDGVSQPAELHTLPALGVEVLYLGYKESKRVDAYGNQFRYRAKVEDARGARVGRWAWDVFLVSVR